MTAWDAFTQKYRLSPLIICGFETLNLKIGFLNVQIVRKGDILKDPGCIVSCYERLNKFCTCHYHCIANLMQFCFRFMTIATASSRDLLANDELISTCPLSICAQGLKLSTQRLDIALEELTKLCNHVAAEVVILCRIGVEVTRILTITSGLSALMEDKSQLEGDLQFDTQPHGQGKGHMQLQALSVVEGLCDKAMHLSNEVKIVSERIAETLIELMDDDESEEYYKLYQATPEEGRTKLAITWMSYHW